MDPVGGPVAGRLELQRIATHVLARRRHDVTGRFGLRATPGGFGTPAFGPADRLEVVRLSGATLLHEVGADVTALPLAGSTLADLAEVVGVDLAAPFSAGDDTPELGEPLAPLRVGPADAARLAGWFDLGWRALDRVAAWAGGAATLQLWPEHFDAGTSVPVGPGPDDRANLGASAGDDGHPEPYLYVGPWSPRRPGDERYWNASFGAVLAAGAVRSVDDAEAFLRRGVELLRG